MNNAFFEMTKFMRLLAVVNVLALPARNEYPWRFLVVDAFAGGLFLLAGQSVLSLLLRHKGLAPLIMALRYKVFAPALRFP
jgi:hypothetical protein